MGKADEGEYLHPLFAGGSGVRACWNIARVVELPRTLVELLPADHALSPFGNRFYVVQGQGSIGYFVRNRLLSAGIMNCMN